MQNKRPFKNVQNFVLSTKMYRPQTFEQYFIYNNRALKLKNFKEYFYKMDAKQRKCNPHSMWLSCHVAVMCGFQNRKWKINK